MRVHAGKIKSDQLGIVCVVLQKLNEWLETDDLDTFKPLRMIINGGGGSGKSVIINTLVTVFRKMFGIDDVIRIAAATGTAAFNVGGETFHHLVGSKPTKGEYQTNTMDKERKKI